MNSNKSILTTEWSKKTFRLNNVNHGSQKYFIMTTAKIIANEDEIRINEYSTSRAFIYEMQVGEYNFKADKLIDLYRSLIDKIKKIINRK